MKLQSTSLLLSLALVAGASIAANSQTDQQQKPARQERCHKLIDGAKNHSQKISDNLDGVSKDVAAAKQSDDANVLKGSLSRVEKKVQEMKIEKDALDKQLAGLDFELRAPLGAY